MNTNNWKDFRITDLFDVVLSKDDLQPKKLEEGEYPLISSGKTTNGVCMYIEKQEKAVLFEGNMITVDMFGKTFYQANPFYCVSHGRVNILKPKIEMNQNIGLYLSTIIDKTIKDKYSFKKMCSSKAISNEIIKMPVNDNGNINMEFIESEISNEMNLVKERFERLSIVNELKEKKINTIFWKEFKVGELFPNIVTPKVYHTREVKEDENGIPYVVRTKFNNGIKYKVKNDEKFILNPANVISFGAENATFFYQPLEYISGRDMYYIDTREYDKAINLFLVSCLQKITEKYSYTFGLFPSLLKEEIIKLPVDSNGEPDWNYMKEYIESIYKTIYVKGE